MFQEIADNRTDSTRTCNNAIITNYKNYKND